MGTNAGDRALREDVSELLIRYAAGIDRRDWRLLRSCFTDDCAADYGEIGSWRSGDAITEWMRRTHEPLGPTLHRISNVAVSRAGDAVEARSYVDVLLVGPDGHGGVQSAGCYDDVVVETEDGWKIARRRFTMVRMQGLETRPPGGRAGA